MTQLQPLVGLRFQNFGESQDRLQRLFSRAGHGNTNRHAVCREALRRLGNCKWTGPNQKNLNSWRRDMGLGRDVLEMNCWEGVLYLAFQAGIYEKKALVDYYNSDKVNVTSWNLLTGQTRLGNTRSLGKIQIPTVGDLVIWPGTEGSRKIIIHVAIYMGMEQGREFVWQQGMVKQYVNMFPAGMFSIVPLAQCSSGRAGGAEFYVAPWV